MFSMTMGSAHVTRTSQLDDGVAHDELQSRDSYLEFKVWSSSCHIGEVLPFVDNVLRYVHVKQSLYDSSAVIDDIVACYIDRWCW